MDEFVQVEDKEEQDHELDLDLEQEDQFELERWVPQVHMRDLVSYSKVDNEREDAPDEEVGTWPVELTK